MPEVANFWKSVNDLNIWHKHRIAELITKKMFGTLSNKKIVVLGFAFKSNTNDTRESAAIQICKDLLDEGAYLKIHDPKVDPKQIQIDLNLAPEQSYEVNNGNMEGKWMSVSILDNDIFLDSDAVLILTEWDVYADLNWMKISKKMRRPAWLFDLRSIIDPTKIENTILNFWRIGDGLR